MALIRPSSMWRQVNPRGAISDFAEVWRQAGGNRWRIALLSAAATIGTFSMMMQEEAIGPIIRPHIDYITVFDPHRTTAQIIASNVENQQRKDRMAAAQAKRDEDVREIYKQLGRASGMDVDAIEQKAKADDAAAARAKAVADAGKPQGAIVRQ